MVTTGLKDKWQKWRHIYCIFWGITTGLLNKSMPLWKYCSLKAVFSFWAVSRRQDGSRGQGAAGEGGGYGTPGTRGLHWAPSTPPQRPTPSPLRRAGGDGLQVAYECAVFNSLLELILFALRAASLIANVDEEFHTIKTGRVGFGFFFS